MREAPEDTLAEDALSYRTKVSGFKEPLFTRLNDPLNRFKNLLWIGYVLLPEPRDHIIYYIYYMVSAETQVPCSHETGSMCRPRVNSYF